MAVPVVESYATAAFGTASAIDLAKPSGLVVGDLLVASVYQIDPPGALSISAPAGWSTLGSVNTPDTFRRGYLFYKIATSIETAASLFTFTSDRSGTFGGGVVRISNVAQIQTSETDTYDGASSGTISFTGSTTPAHTDALVVVAYYAWEGTGSASISSYTSTPSKTWTEVFDLGTTTGNDPVMSLAYATAGSTAQITAYGASLSVSKKWHGGILFVITPPQNATGTNALFSVSPTHFSQNGIGGTTGTNTLLSVSPTLLTQSGDVSVPTVWTTTPKS